VHSPPIRAAIAGSLFFGLACTGLSAPEVPSAEPEPPAKPAPPPSMPPNVLVLVADDLGVDKVGAYEEHPAAPPTPHIDALAAQGVRFTHAYSYPTCSATRAALLTGRYGRRNGMGGIVALDTDTWELPLDEVLLPELLKDGDERFSTAAVGKWHLSGHLTEHPINHALLQGFDSFEGTLGNLVLTMSGKRGNYESFEKVSGGQVGWKEGYATVDTADDAVSALGRLEPPWLLYVAFNAPHTPFHRPPKDVLGRKLKKDATDLQKFDATVEVMDAQIGRILEAMDAKTRAQTMVIFLGDNGTDKDATLPPLNPKHAKGSVMEQGTNVPLIVTGPMVKGRGVASDALVHVVDVLPTVAESTGIRASGPPLDGQSFLAVLADPAAKGPRTTVYTEKFNPIGGGPYNNDYAAIRDDRYKLVQTEPGSYERYDLRGRLDDGPVLKKKKLSDEQKKRFKALQAELERIRERAKFAY
jgi:arylsulfatase A-like enzyme